MLSGALHGAITWKAAQETQEADLFTKNLLYTFEGKNSGSEEIEISSVRSSCPCVVASVSETTIQPGSTFLVAAEFDPNEMGGLQNQRIFLEIDGQQKAEVLKVTAVLPELLSVSPKRLFWNSSSDPEAQSVELTLSEKMQVELGDVYAMDENFFTSLEQISETKFLLKVTPRDTKIERPAAVMIRFMAESRKLKITIPCLIGEKNPFEIDFRPKPQARQASFETLKADLSEHNTSRVQGIQKSQEPTFPRPLNSEQ